MLPHLIALSALALGSHGGSDPGAQDGSGLALRAAKVLTCAWDGPQVFDGGVVLVRNGKIEAVGRAQDVAIPDGYELVDVGQRWLSPGMIGLHCHAAGPSIFQINDLNDMVYLTNPGLRASASTEQGIRSMKMAAAGGVTTVLYIPGSGTNIGGQGVLVKTPFDRYEESLLRNPGSMKLAQWGNPESWTVGVTMTFEHWNTRNTLRRGVAYAERWEAYERGEAPEPERNIQFDVFRDLVKGETAISTHTQLYQVVLMTLTMVARDFRLPVFLDHSTIGGWLTGGLAEELGVPAIVGPRAVDTTSRFFLSWARNKHEGFRGVAAGYQEQGNTMVGFNTDSPIVPQEELPLQGAMGVRYGFDESAMQMVRGLTIVAAKAAKVDHRVGSLEVGKDADILVSTGHPADPRTAIEIVFVDGRRAYDAERDGRRW